MEDILIVGGGAAGLMAANKLLGNGYKVVILEANDRLGGRIHTIHDKKFEQPVEKGVEFIHGNLPLTMEIIKQAELEYKPVKGKMFRKTDGQWNQQDEFAKDWNEMMKKMNVIDHDLALADFLNEYFSDKKYDELREMAIRFAEGFDGADINKASTIALRAEWMEEDHEQFRVPGGFDQLVNWLADECRKKGGDILTSQKVERIKWRKNEVTVFTEEGISFSANKIIVTVPIGILQADPPLINFQPYINNYLEAARKIGFGNVVKVLLQFKIPFWQKKKKNIGFVFSKQKIPTWWTQLSVNENLLTGWAGGGQAIRIDSAGDGAILDLAVESVSKIFEMESSEIGSLLTAATVANWKEDPFSKGAYSYSMLETMRARQLLNEPIADTIFFAGEGLHDGASPGTVEAALVSGRNTAEKLMGSEPA
jgi:monoamine oxidase